MLKSILISYWGSKCSKISKCFYFVFLVGKKKHMFSLSGHLAFGSFYLLLKIHSIFPQKGHRLHFFLIWTSNSCIIAYTDVSFTWIFGLICFSFLSALILCLSQSCYLFHRALFFFFFCLETLLLKPMSVWLVQTGYFHISTAIILGQQFITFWAVEFNALLI